MKKILLAGAVAFFGVMNAQMEKGSWVVGGSTTLGYNDVNNKVKVEGHTFDGLKVSTFTVTPSVGYFVIDNLAVGMDLGYTSITTKFEDEKSTQDIFKILPSATYYFKTGSKIYPFLGAGVGYASISDKEDGAKSTMDGFAWKVKGGLTYMVTPTVGIDLGVSYDQFTDKNEIAGVDFRNNVNTLGVNAGFSFFFK